MAREKEEGTFFPNQITASSADSIQIMRFVLFTFVCNLTLFFFFAVAFMFSCLDCPHTVSSVSPRSGKEAIRHFYCHWSQTPFQSLGSHSVETQPWVHLQVLKHIEETKQCNYRNLPDDSIGLKLSWVDHVEATVVMIVRFTYTFHFLR